MPAGAGSAAEPPVVRRFESRVLLSAGTLAPTEFCDVGLRSEGFALDVLDGTFDGFWWNSTCIDGDRATGRWYIYYMGGEFASALAGDWAGAAGVTTSGVAYVGRYTLTEAFGPWTGLTGNGDITVFFGAQQWVKLSGTVTIPV